MNLSRSLLTSVGLEKEPPMILFNEEEECCFDLLFCFGTPQTVRCCYFCLSKVWRTNQKRQSITLCGTKESIRPLEIMAREKQPKSKSPSSSFFAQCDWLTPDFQHTFFDEAVVAYDDVRTLRPGQWLTDSILTFYYLFLTNKVVQENTSRSADTFLLINPTLTFWLSMSPDSAQEIFGEMDMSSKELIFMPVTDSEDMESAGSGSHWSLVIYNKSQDTFYSYDSHHNHNKAAARRLAKAMAPLVSQQFKFESRPTPQQTNGADCGCFVLAITECLMNHSGNDSQLSDICSTDVVAGYRSKICNLIGDLL